jgi:Ca2+-binding EF-hand superfamily protein
MDADADGFLTESDFSALAARWTANRGQAPGEVSARRLTEIMMSWWETLLAASDADGDEVVSLDEVLRVVDDLVADTTPVAATAVAMFEAIDRNGDGRISGAEYRELIETWTGQPTDTGEVFGLLDGDGDGHLSRDEFVALWTEFWAGDNPNAAGTWVFGRFALPLRSV